MTAETDGEEDTQQRQLSDTPLLTRHSEVAREQKTQADRSSHSNMAHGQKRHNRHPQDRRQQPPLHVEVKRLQKEVTSLHAEMRHLEEHMDSLRETVINASEASSEAVRGVLLQLQDLCLVDSEKETISFHQRDQLIKHLQKENEMDTEDNKSTISPAATIEPETTQESEGMGPVTKAIIGGVTLAITFTAGLVFGKRRGYSQAMTQIED